MPVVSAYSFRVVEAYGRLIFLLSIGESVRSRTVAMDYQTPALVYPSVDPVYMPIPKKKTGSSLLT